MRLISPKKLPAVSSAIFTSALVFSGFFHSSTRPPAMMRKSLV